MAGFILCLIIIVLSVAGLGLGVLMGRGRLRGSCGGQVGGDEVSCACETRLRPKARS